MAQVSTRIDIGVRARFFKGLADPSRLAILEALRRGELGATQIAETTGLSVSNTSRHLACLRDCGLLEARQVWRNVYYRLAGPHVEHLLAEAAEVLQVVAEKVDACRRPEMQRL